MRLLAVVSLALAACIHRVERRLVPSDQGATLRRSCGGELAPYAAVSRGATAGDRFGGDSAQAVGQKGRGDQPLTRE